MDDLPGGSTQEPDIAEESYNTDDLSLDDLSELLKTQSPCPQQHRNFPRHPPHVPDPPPSGNTQTSQPQYDGSVELSLVFAMS